MHEHRAVRTIAPPLSETARQVGTNQSNNFRVIRERLKPSTPGDLARGIKLSKNTGGSK